MTSVADKFRRVNGAGAKFQAHIGRVRLGPVWLLIVPAGTWGIATFAFPILDPSLTVMERWLLAAATALLIVVSAVLHSYAHVLAAKVTRSIPPQEIPVTLFGDPAQVWADSREPWHDAVTAAAGPVFSAAVSWVAWWLWNSQVNAFISDAAFILAVYNVVLAAANATPTYPFDGARLASALLRGIAGVRLRTPRLAVPAGYSLVVTITIWGFTLLFQDERFSFATAAIAFTLAGLVLIPLLFFPPTRAHRVPSSAYANTTGAYVRAALVAPVILVLFLPFAGLMPVNEGIQAPGSAVETEEMVSVPEEMRHDVSGSLMLTTIILQTPIIAFEWAAAQISPVIALVPPERVVPPGTTPQSVARQAYNALVTSEETAAIVAVRLAGYDVTTTSQGAFVNSVSEDSPAVGILEPGDVIVGFNGQPVASAEDLVELVQAADPSQPAELQVLREDEPMELTVDLAPPDSPDGTPRIGITIDTTGLEYHLPFPVDITPKKIAGGPSAGLMFTLTVYDMLTEDDLTGGRKIAGTGTIDINGNVGPIGGVQQKVAAAERAGAEYFLCPAQNYADAAAVANSIQVVQVTTAEEAIAFLSELPPA